MGKGKHSTSHGWINWKRLMLVNVADLLGREGVLLIADARLDELQEAGANRCEAAVGKRDLCGESRGGGV